MASLDTTRQQIRRRATFAVSHAARRLEQDIRVDSPVDTGEMRNGSTVRATGLTATTHIQADYASYVREGTRPHPIRPKTKQYLAFFWPQAPERMRRLPDGRVLSKGVNHPGTRPNDWYDRAIGNWPNLLRDGLRASPD